MIPTDVNQSDAYKNLINFCLDIPIAFAIWENQSDIILISSKMQSLIRSDSFVINSISFIKAIKPIFGNFLYDAVGKISTTQFSNGKYSIIFKTPYNKLYSLILHYNLKSQIYIFTALDITNNSHLIDNNSNNLQNEIKILNEILDKIPLYIWRRTKDSKILYSNKYCTNNLGNKISSLGTVFNNTNPNTDTNATVKIKGEDKTLNINEYYSVYNNKSDNTNTPIIGIAQDITELNSIKKEIESYKKNYYNIENIINNINCGIALFDSNMKLLCINDYTRQLFKLLDTDVYSKSYSEIVDYILSNELIVSNLSNTILRNKLLEILSIAKDKPLEKQLSINNRDNINVNIIPDSKGNILFVFYDNSCSIDMARNTNSVKQMYGTVINNISEGIIIFGPDNKIRIYNDIIKSIFNINNENIDNLNIKDFFELLKNLFNNISYFEHFIKKLLNNATQRTGYSEIITLLNNKTIDYTYVPLHDGLNLIKIKDISNYKSLESALQNAADKVNKALELKTKLLSTISDEYFAPLDTISSFAEILNNKYFGELNDKQREYCLGIIKTSNHLKDIAEMINYITRIQVQLDNESISNYSIQISSDINNKKISGNIDPLKLNLTEVNIQSFIKTTVEQFNILEKNVKILTTCNNNSLKAYIDKTILNRILYYSISQALYMIDDSGIIQIESALYEEDNKYFSITISNNGYELSQEDVIIYNRYLSNNINIAEIKTMNLRYSVLHYLVYFHNGKIMLETNSKASGTTNAEVGSKIKILLQIAPFNN